MHYSHLIQAEVDQCLTSVHSAQFLGVWLNLLGKFPESISGTNEEEKPRVGLLCAGMVHQILSKIVDKIGTLINTIAPLIFTPIDPEVDTIVTRESEEF